MAYAGGGYKPRREMTYTAPSWVTLGGQGFGIVAGEVLRAQRARYESRYNTRVLQAQAAADNAAAAKAAAMARSQVQNVASPGGNRGSDLDQLAMLLALRDNGASPANASQANPGPTAFAGGGKWMLPALIIGGIILAAR